MTADARPALRPAAVPWSAAAAPSRGRLVPHLPFALLLVGGAAVRGWALATYDGALRAAPSAGYLHDAHTLLPSSGRPLGYGLFLAALPTGGAAAAVAVAQHVLGLLMAVALYLLLVRRGVPAWGAALATAPVLLDGWQVAVEQYVLSDTLFEALVVAAVVLLTWRPRPGPALAAAVGLCLGLAALTRGAGLLLFVPAALTVALTGARARAVAALVLTFAGTLGGYAVAYHEFHGAFATTQISGRMLYGRLAPIADCTGLTLPAYEKPLCPAQSSGHRWSSVRYRTDPASPALSVRPPGELTDNAMLRDFAGRVVVHQPLAYAEAVAVDALRPFAVGRPMENDSPLPGQGFLRGYASRAQLPGPALALLLAAAVAGVAGAGRARRSGLRAATFGVASVGVTALVTAAAFAGFSWRYALPVLVLLPAAAALAVTGLVREPAVPAADVPWWTALPGPAQRMFTAGHGGRLARYAAGSVICTLISTAVLIGLLAGGVLGSRASSLLASAIGSLAGYWLNRNWTFGVKGMGTLRRDMIPYWATVVVTAVAAALVTGATNAAIRHITDHTGVRAVGDAIAYLATYGFFFVAKYVVFNRLFAGRRDA